MQLLGRTVLRADRPATQRAVAVRPNSSGSALAAALFKGLVASRGLRAKTSNRLEAEAQVALDF